MTVADLMHFLEAMPPDLPVVAHDKYGMAEYVPARWSLTVLKSEYYAFEGESVDLSPAIIIGDLWQFDEEGDDE